MKTTLILFQRSWFALLVVLSLAPPAFAQPPVRISLHPGQTRCFENTILMKHVAEIRTSDARLQRTIESLDLDSFGDHPSTSDVPSPIEISKAQIRFRLRLAGLSEEQMEISGPDRLTVIGAEATNLRQDLENRLQQQLAQQYFMSADDVKVTLDPRFADLESAGLDFSAFTLQATFDPEMPLGNQQLVVLIPDGSGRLESRKIPVSIALIRDMVVARENISQGQILSADNIAPVRRPVDNRNVRFASFEQVVGKQAQSELQQYELIKSSAIQTATSRTGYVIKKNAQVSVIVRRGGLTVVLKDAKALTDGNPGEPISLINPKTKERIVATVVDAMTAEVRF